MRLFLVDNGSLRVAAYRNLQCLAAGVTDRLGQSVDATPLLHANRIPPEDLAPGEAKPITWEKAFRTAMKSGEAEFGLIPLFLGPTGAITEYLPERLRFLREEKAFQFKLHLAPFLFPGVAKDDGRLTDILAAQIRETIAKQNLKEARPPVLLVDHGSPRPEVTFVRNFIAGQLQERLRAEVACIGTAAMERRDGSEYAFNDPLLEAALLQPGFAGRDVIVAMFFISPGRHAGPGGDVVQICAAAEAQSPGLRCHLTPLLADHPHFVDLVTARARTLPLERAGQA